MTPKDDLLKDIEETRERFQHLLDSIPESEYTRQSGNASWTGRCAISRHTRAARDSFRGVDDRPRARVVPVWDATFPFEVVQPRQRLVWAAGSASAESRGVGKGLRKRAHRPQVRVDADAGAGFRPVGRLSCRVGSPVGGRGQRRASVPIRERTFRGARGAGCFAASFDCATLHSRVPAAQCRQDSGSY